MATALRHNFSVKFGPLGALYAPIAQQAVSMVTGPVNPVIQVFNVPTAGVGLVPSVTNGFSVIVDDQNNPQRVSVYYRTIITGLAAYTVSAQASGMCPHTATFNLSGSSVGTVTLINAGSSVTRTYVVSW